MLGAERKRALGERDGRSHVALSSSVPARTAGVGCGDGMVKKNRALAGLTRLMCPVLNKSLKKETKMPGGFSLRSHGPPLGLRVRQLT